VQSIEIPPVNRSARSAVPLQNIYHRLKRVLELLLASIALLMSLPVLVVACIAIVKESQGSPIFTQRRLGAGGKPFKLYKLRTMYQNTEHASCVTLPADPRVTRVGRWLRDAKIDELPQLLNILLGEMSIIGPRPLSEVECNLLREGEFDDDLPGFIPLRPPGLIGIEQLNRNHNLPYVERFALNALYEQRAGWELDLQIIFQSLFQCRVVVYCMAAACICEILLLFVCGKGISLPWDCQTFISLGTSSTAGR